MEILDASGDSVRMKMSGGELGLGNLEGKVITFPKHSDHRKTFIGKFAHGAGGQLYKLPPVSQGRTLQQCMETIKESNMLGHYYGNPLFLDQSIVFKDNEIFFNLGDEQGEKVQYFGLQDELTDELSQNVHYKIEYLKNGKIKVSSEYLSKAKDKDGNEKDSWETKGYSREMDYNNFLIFIATKKLKPKTESQQKEEKDNNEKKLKENKIPLTKKGWNWFTINNIIHMVKDCRKKIDGLVEEYSKEKDENFMNMVVENRGLYRNLGKLFGAVGRTGGAEAASRAEMEHWNEKDNRIWKKIKKRLDEFDKDPDF
jgi:hypothetical protein